MALSNAQYDEIMRAYDKRQLQNKFIHEKTYPGCLQSSSAPKKK